MPVPSCTPHRHRAAVLRPLALLAACGGETVDQGPAARAPSADVRRHALAADATVPNDKVFAWAQQTYPDLFGNAPPHVMQLPYQGRSFDVRYYAARGAYLGIADGKVFGMGGFTGGASQRLVVTGTVDGAGGSGFMTSVP